MVVTCIDFVGPSDCAYRITEPSDRPPTVGPEAIVENGLPNMTMDLNVQAIDSHWFCYFSC